jgi:hypothetical protein
MKVETKFSGAWIFVSHSHRDLDKVRRIRNYLEQRGTYPLLFFLKCLSDDDARLPDLIRDEIMARNWFVLCDSPHSRNSNWVSQEQAFVLEKDDKGKGVEVIDLEQDLEPQLPKLDRICKRATVFLSYARVDAPVANRIQDALQEHDFSVWLDSAIEPGCDWSTELHTAIDNAIARGFALVLLSPASLTNQWCKHETDYALQIASQSKRSNVIPVVIAPFPPELLPLQLANIQWFDLTIGIFEQRVLELIRSLKTRAMD